MRGGNVDVLGMYEVHNQKGAKTYKGDLTCRLSNRQTKPHIGVNISQICACVTLMYRDLTVLIREIVIRVSRCYFYALIFYFFGIISYNSRNLDDDFGTF